MRKFILIVELGLGALVAILIDALCRLVEDLATLVESLVGICTSWWYNRHG